MQMNQMGSAGSLVMMPGDSSGGTSSIVYFACADCAVEEERAVKEGARIHTCETSIGEHGFISLLSDTEGNMIGLHSME